MKRIGLVTGIIVVCVGATTAYVAWSVRGCGKTLEASNLCFVVAREIVTELAKGGQVQNVLPGHPVTPVMQRLELGEYGDLTARGPVDPWGQTLSAQVVAAGEWVVVEVRSSGPDGIVGNEDDRWHQERLRRISEPLGDPGDGNPENTHR